MKTIRWGIIGCGKVTEVKSGPGFQKAKNSELVAVMRRNTELARDYAMRHQVPRWYDNAHDLISDSEVDAVYIATPPSSHMEYTLACAKAKKPVYVEKPMALSYSQGLQMIKACEDARVELFVAYYRRAMPRFLKIKELLSLGAIGDVRYVKVTINRPPLSPDEKGILDWRVLPDISGGGIFMDLASHTLDYLDFLFGPIVEAWGLSGNQAGLYAPEDITTAGFRFQSGVYGTGCWCFSSFEKTDVNEIVGSNGKLLFSSFDQEPITLITKEGTQTIDFPYPQHVQQPLIQTIVDHLNQKGECPSTGHTALRTTYIMDKILGRFSL